MFASSSSSNNNNNIGGSNNNDNNSSGEKAFRMMPTFTNQPSLDVELATVSSEGSSVERRHNQQQDNDLDMDASFSSHHSRLEEGLVSEAATAKPPTSRVFESSTGFEGIMAVVMYSFCSISMILVNKSLTSSYNHLIYHDETTSKRDLITLLVVFQAMAAVVFAWVCRFAKVLVKPSDVELQGSVLKDWAPVNIFFCFMLFTSMVALQTNSVPMVTVFKNVANISTATADYFLFGNPLEPLSIAAFAVMLLGAVAAAGNDMQTSWVGLLWMLLNCAATSGYVCYMKYATQSIKLSKFGMVYVNNILCVAFLLPVAWVNGEIDLFFKSTALHTAKYGFQNLFAGFVGFFLNAASLNCVSVTGPTTYAIVGSINKVPVTLLGYFIFHDQLSAQTWLFVCVALLGGFLYTYAKLSAKKHQKEASRN